MRIKWNNAPGECSTQRWGHKCFLLFHPTLQHSLYNGSSYYLSLESSFLSGQTPDFICFSCSSDDRVCVVPQYLCIVLSVTIFLFISVVVWNWSQYTRWSDLSRREWPLYPISTWFLSHQTSLTFLGHSICHWSISSCRVSYKFHHSLVRDLSFDQLRRYLLYYYPMKGFVICFLETQLRFDYAIPGIW